MKYENKIQNKFVCFVKRYIFTSVMAYSSLNTSKFGDCSQCSAKDTNVVKVGKDLFCLSCHRLNKGKKQLAKKKEILSIRALGRTKENIELKNDYDLNKWFDEIAKEIEKNPCCWECGSWIPPEYYRCATAHIFPKKIFPSISTHPLNYLILSAGCGCHDKTHTLSEFSKMKVFSIAIERFKQFQGQIRERHKYLNEFEKLVESKLLVTKT